MAAATALSVWMLSRPAEERPGPFVRPTAGSCEVGPWAVHCPEAGWAREVAEVAGFEVTGHTGSALELRGSGRSFHLWAFTPEEPELRAEGLEEGRYSRERVIGGVPVHGDGQRLTWEAYGLHVWLSNAELGGIDASVQGVGEIVRASARVRWP